SNSCPVLAGPENFQIWQIRILGKLRREKVHDIVTSPTPPPTPQTPKTDSWDIHNGKAHGIIVDHISDRLALEMAGIETAADLYQKLWDGDVTTVQEHIASLAAADAKLTAMKKPIDPEFLSFLLLHSLPDDPTWETFKSSVLNSMPAGTKLSFSELSDRITFQTTHIQGSS
ncbi:hypothetical protein CPC08DRAFT_612866, partial [Agrocybe pediades]